MRIYEYGQENPEGILLIHPSLVTWDYFENVIPLLKKDYHLLIPALPGYDLQDLSEGMIRETKERLSRTAIATVGDSEKMPLESCLWTIAGHITIKNGPADSRIVFYHGISPGNGPAGAVFSDIRARSAGCFTLRTAFQAPDPAG